MRKERIDPIKMLKEFCEEQGYDVWEEKSYLSVSEGCMGADGVSFVKDKLENFLMSIYDLGHNAGYSKGLKDMRHIQATIKEEGDEEEKKRPTDDIGV